MDQLSKPRLDARQRIGLMSRARVDVREPVAYQGTDVVNLLLGVAGQPPDLPQMIAEPPKRWWEKPRRDGFLFTTNGQLLFVFFLSENGGLADARGAVGAAKGSG